MDYSDDTRREITAFFDDRASAERAKVNLIDAGLPASSIRMVEGQSSDMTSAQNTASHDKGFFEMLGDFFMPDDDRSTYAEGLRRGGYIVSVMVSGAHTDVALSILDDEGAIDMDDRRNQYETEGWTARRDTDSYDPSLGMAGMGATPSTLGMAEGTTEFHTSTDQSYQTSGGYASGGSGSLRSSGDDSLSGLATGQDPIGGTDDTMNIDMTTKSGSGYATTGSSSAQSSAGGYGSQRTGTDSLSADEVISVMEERLNVGKRDVANGRVRVRSYIVETPVAEDITLRSERVSIDRHPVDRAVQAGDDLFRERTIEMDETSQEAVVSKTARVVEEIGIHKEVDERTETISDSVRRTEVEIDDERLDETTRSGFTETTRDTTRR